MQPPQPQIRKCQNSNSFFSKKGTKTTMCFNIRGPMCPEKSSFMPTQGQLQIWTGHSTLIFENLKPVEISKNHFNII